MKGAIAAGLRRLERPHPLPWRLQCWPVCASTEVHLDRWLEQDPALPLAVLARRQTRGHGQRGRPWMAPSGGVWLSAALPWPAQADGAAALGLAVAVGLALELEALDLQPQIKWPNDLLLQGRKVAGLLPRLRWRGDRILAARVGVGLNGCNRVPPEGIALVASHPWAGPERLAPRVLRALEWAVAAARQPELVRRQAQQRLWRSSWLDQNGVCCQPLALRSDGSLEALCAGRPVHLQRHF